MPYTPPDIPAADSAGESKPDFDRLRQLPLPQLVDEVRADQTQRWRAGRRVLAEVYLEALPALAESREDALVVIVGEQLLRTECGPKPVLEEFQQRFPQWREELAATFALDGAISLPRTQVRAVEADGVTPPTDSKTGGFEIDSSFAGDGQGQPLGETGVWVQNEGPADGQNKPSTVGRDPGWPRIPGYDILALLGEGGMGLVYKARHVSLKRLVALKMIRASQVGTQALERFRREAEAVARLQHPNVVQVFEIGSCNGEPFLSLEYVDGGSLTSKIDGEPQDPQETTRLLETLARTVHYAHQMNVVHRDLKPGNVLLTKEGVPKLTDFGLAKQLDDASRLTQNAILGTPNYMAPEQADSKFGPMSPLADVYGLGAILYDCLTGRPPFKGQNVHETVRQVLTDELVPPFKLQPKLPRDLNTICWECLHKEPKQRYGSALELADDLRRYLDGEPIRRRPASSVERAVRWCRRNPRVAALTALVFGLITTVAITSTVFAFKISHERDLTEGQRQRAEEHAQVAMAQADIVMELVYNQVTGVYTRVRDRSDDPTRLLGDLLEDALNALDQVATGAENTALAQRTRAGVLQRKGDIYLALGRTPEARRQFEECQNLVKALLELHPNDPLVLRANGVILLRLGQLSEGSQKLEYYRASMQARGARHALQPNEPDALAQMALGCGALGQLEAESGNPSAAVAQLLEELSWRDGYKRVVAENTNMLRERAGMYSKLGEAYSKLENWTEMNDFYARAHQLRSELLAGNPANEYIRDDLALSALNLGDVLLLHRKDVSAARGSYEEAVRLRQSLDRPSPESLERRGRLAAAYYRLGTACWYARDFVKAEEYFAKCLDIREAAFKANVPRSQTPYMLALARCGRHGDAVKIADRIRALPNPSSEQLIYGAGGYALCLAALQHPKADPSPGADSSALAERYTAGALDCVRRAIKKGWKDAVTLETDPDLDPIRQHPGFVALVEEVKRANAGGQVSK